MFGVLAMLLQIWVNFRLSFQEMEIQYDKKVLISLNYLDCQVLRQKTDRKIGYRNQNLVCGLLKLIQKNLSTR